MVVGGRLTGAHGAEVVEEARRVVDERGPLRPLTSVGTVLEFHSCHTLHAFDGRYEGDPPQEAVGGVLDRPSNLAVQQVEHRMCNELVEDVGSLNAGSVTWEPLPEIGKPQGVRFRPQRRWTAVRKARVANLPSSGAGPTRWGEVHVEEERVFEQLPQLLAVVVAGDVEREEGRRLVL